MNFLEPDITEVLVGLAADVNRLTDVIKNQQSLFENLIPVLTNVVALIVAGLTFWSSKYQQKTSRDIATQQIQATQTITIAQINANLVAASRKEWIEKLRMSISRLLALTTAIMHQELIKEKSVEQEVLDEFVEKQTYIELMLNPNEPEHRDLNREMLVFTNICWDEHDKKGENGDEYVFSEENSEKWIKARDSFVEKAKHILKAEWDKVKELK